MIDPPYVGRSFRRKPLPSMVMIALVMGGKDGFSLDDPPTWVEDSPADGVSLKSIRCEMEIRKLILATIAGLAAMLFLSAIWHDLLMHDFYAAHSPTLRPEPLLRLIGLGYFILTTLMVVIYPKGYEGGVPWLEGLRFGMLIGILHALPRGLVLYGAEGCHTGMLVVVDAAWHLAEQGAGGIVIALIHGGNGGPTNK